MFHKMECVAMVVFDSLLTRVEFERNGSSGRRISFILLSGNDKYWKVFDVFISDQSAKLSYMK